MSTKNNSLVHQGLLDSRQEITDARIFDTTLRDGEQSPGVSFSYDEKREIASILDDMNTHVIEGGFPVSSDAEFEAVRDIAEATSTTTCALARIVDEDIEAALDTGVDQVLVFASTSDVQLQDSMQTSREEILERSVKAVQRVTESGATAIFAPMDATRTDETFLKEVITTVSEVGPEWIAIPDTCGVATPERFYELISKITDWTEAKVDVHPQNDFGLATNNALAGLRAGAAQAQVTINGIGERGGNASYEEVVMALESLYDIETGIDTSRLIELSEIVESCSDVAVSKNKPVVGDNAFAHESGIHTAGVIENPDTFEPGVMIPEMVGAERNLVIGKHSGKHVVRKRIEEAGYNPTEQEVEKLTSRLKEYAAEKNEITQEVVDDFLDECRAEVDSSGIHGL